MCFNDESNLPLEIPLLQFCLALKSFLMTYLKRFFNNRYHLQACRFVNCSAPELHFSTCFFGNWPQNSRVASSPILVPEASWAFSQFVFLIWKLEWQVPVQTPRACLSLVPPLPLHPPDKFPTVRKRVWRCWLPQVGRLLGRRLEVGTRAPGDEEMRCLFQTLPDHTVYHPLHVPCMF